MEQKELALIYHPEAVGPDGPKVQAVLKELEIPARRVTPGELCFTVGALAGLNAPENDGAVVEPLPQSAIIFCSLSEQRLREALSRLNEAGAGKGSLKAVLTSNNRDWRFCDLLAELNREREAFAQMRKVAQEGAPKGN